MALDPTLQAWLAKTGLKPIDWRASTDAARRQFWRMAHTLESDAPQMLETRAVTITGGAAPLPARLYVPFAAGVKSPLLVYFHGGGFVSGDLDSHEMVCRRLADSGRLRVLSVAYRLAPEHKWPAAPNDALAALAFAHAEAAALGADRDRLAVGGDSAGGNLAAVTALVGRGALWRPAAQLLIYPCVQLVKMAPMAMISLREGRDMTQQVSQAAQDWVRDAYLPQPEDAFDWRASPLMAPDHRGAPPALIVTAGIDPLHEEGKAYADTLAANGVATVLRHYPREMHGFFNMTGLSASARAAVDDCGRWLAATLEARAR